MSRVAECLKHFTLTLPEQERVALRAAPDPVAQVNQMLAEVKRGRETVRAQLAERKYDVAPKQVEVAPKESVKVAPSTGKDATDVVAASVGRENTNGDGGLNTLTLFQLRDAEGWVKDNLNNEELKKLFGEKAVKSLERAMLRTAAIYAHLGFTPEEMRDNPWRDNMDPQFSTTFDLSTDCPQQDMYVALINALEVRAGRIFTPEERFKVGSLMKDTGISTACWYCYGQATRDLFDHQLSLGLRIMNDARMAILEKGEPLVDLDAFEKATKAVEKYSAELKSAKGTKEDVSKIRARLTKAKAQMEQELADASKVFRKYVGNPTIAKLDKEGKAKGGALYAVIHKYGANLPVIDELTLRDAALGKVELKGAQLELMKALRDYAQGASGRNAVKGFASYTHQLLDWDQNLIDFLNDVGGARLNSQTDFRAWHVVDLAQAMTHAAQRGLGMHCYVKEPWFPKIFGDTGIKFNLSMEAVTKADGTVEFDSMEGFPPDAASTQNRSKQAPIKPEDSALELQKRNKNCGVMLMAADDLQVLFGMERPEVKMMIPFHRGRLSVDITAAKGAVDFTRWQHEDWSNAKPDPKFVKKTAYGVAVTLDDGSVAELRQNPEGKGKHPLITQRAHKNDKARYFEICEKLGVRPKWAGLRLFRSKDAAAKRERLAKLEASKKGVESDEYKALLAESILMTGHPGYMKTVRDIAATGSEQKPVDPTKINWDAANEFLDYWIKQGGDQKVASDKLVEWFALKLQEQGQGQSPVRDEMMQLVYHGTPHRGIDKFSLEKVGTGSGRQSHGWGLYFTSNRDMAEYFRTSLSRTAALNELRPILQEADFLGFANVSQALKAIEQNPDWETRWALTSEQAAAVKNVLRKMPGQLYAVDIPSDEDLLDADKPLAQQTEKVKTAIAALGLETTDAEGKELTGLDLYGQLAQRLEQTPAGPGQEQGDGQMRASSTLLAAGVPGLRYTDNNSGASSYVIWDESAIQTIKTFYARKGGVAQGSTQFDRTGKATINLFKGSADLSTFAHEIHHVLVRDLETLVASGLASEQDVNDLRVLQAHAAKRADELLPNLRRTLAAEQAEEKRRELEAAIAEIEKNGGADWVAQVIRGEAEATDAARVINVHFQEISARNWEAYLREGKAPSVELAGVFATFKRYLKIIYQSISRLGLTEDVPADVRAVFDRMLASDEEIEQAKTFYEGVEDFEDLVKADAAERERLRVARQAADDDSAEAGDRKVVSAYMRAEGTRAKLAEQAAKDVDADPVQDMIRQIKELKGIATKAFDALPLSEASRQIELLRRHGQSMVVKGEKACWDSIAQAAEAFGFPSEEAFLAAIESAPLREKAIKARTDELVAQAEADLMASLSENGPVPGDEAYHVESRLIYLVAQAQMLKDRATRAKGAQTAKLNAKVIKDAADAAVSGLPLKEVRYDVFARQEARFSRLAKAALKAGDLAKAEEMMQKQIQNHAMASAALRAKEVQRKLEREARRLGRLTPERFEFDNREAILWLLEKYRLGTKSMVPEKPEQVNIGKMLSEMENATGEAPAIPDWVYQSPRPYTELSLEQLQDVIDSMRQLAAQGRKDLRSKILSEQLQKVLGLGGDVLVEDAAAQLAAPMAQLKDKTPVAENHPLFGVQAFGRKVIANLSLVPLLAKEMDGYTNFGPKGKIGPNEALMRATAECASNAMQMWKDKVAPHLEGKGKLAEGFRQLRARLEKLHGGRYFDIKQNGVEVPLTTDPALLARFHSHGLRQWTAERLFLVALNSGNQGNVDALLAAFGWDELQFETLLSQLTAEEWALADEVRALIDQFYKPMDDVYFAINDTHTKKVDALPRTIYTADGQVIAVKGGYFPLIFDHRLSDKAGAQQEKDLMKDRASAVHRSSSTKSGFAKERKGGKLPVRLDLSVLYDHLQDVIHYTTHAELVKDLDRLTKQPAWAAAVRKAFGTQMYDEVRDWVKNIARPEVGPVSWMDQLFTRYRHLSTVYALGLNLKTAAKQVIGLTTVAQDIGWDWTMHGLKTLITRRGAAIDGVREKSVYVADREKSIDREITESLSSSLKPDAREVEIMGRRITKHDLTGFMYTFITAVDRVCVVTAWEGAYQKALYAGKSEADARAEGDAAVANSQPSARAMDLAGLQRGKGASRMFTQFMSWTIKYGHRTRAHLRGWREGKITTAEYTRHVLNEQLLPVLGVVVINQLWSALRPKKKKERPVWEDFFLEGLSQILSGYPILNRVPSAIEYGEQGLTEAPPLKPLLLHYRTGKAAAKFFDDEGTVEDDATAFLYALAQSTSLELGIPWLNVARDIRGAYNTISGTEESK